MEGVHSKIKFLAIFSEKNRIGRVKMVLTRKEKVINRQKPIVLKLAQLSIYSKIVNRNSVDKFK